MKHISRYFKSYEIGSVCTGLIMHYGLSTKELLKRKIVKIETVSYPAEILNGITTPTAYADHYVFLGFDGAEAEL